MRWERRSSRVVISRHLMALASPAVVIVNESMARWLWPGKNRDRKTHPRRKARRAGGMAVDDGHRRGRKYETLHV